MTPRVLVVPGASAPAFRAMTDQTLLDYLRHAAAHAEVTASVCSGSLILGAAGLLKGRKATTHWSAFDLLDEFGAIAVKVPADDDGLRAHAPGDGHRLRRAAAVDACLVRRRSHDAARPAAADEHRLAAQRRVVELLDRREERVHVDVQDRTKHERHVTKNYNVSPPIDRVFASSGVRG